MQERERFFYIFMHFFKKLHKKGDMRHADGGGHAAEVTPQAGSAADGDGEDLGVVFWDGLGVDDLRGCWRGSWRGS